jgi:hypothetical protein
MRIDDVPQSVSRRRRYRTDNAGLAAHIGGTFTDTDALPMCHDERRKDRTC